VRCNTTYSKVIGGSIVDRQFDLGRSPFFLKHSIVKDVYSMLWSLVKVNSRATIRVSFRLAVTLAINAILATTHVAFKFSQYGHRLTATSAH